MKKDTILLLITLVASVLSFQHAHGAALYPVEVNDRWGFISKHYCPVQNPNKHW